MFPPRAYILQGLVQIGICLLLDPGGNPISRLGNAAGDGGQGIAVAAQGDGIADRVLKIPAFQECDDGLGHRLLAGHVETIARTDRIQGPGQVVAVFPFDVGLDVLLARSQIPMGGPFLSAAAILEIPPAKDDRIRGPPMPP